MGDNMNIKMVQCNKCGKMAKLHNDDLIATIVETNLMHEFNIKFLYGSTKDLQETSIGICEDCLFEWMETFKIKPVYKDYEI